MPFQAAVLVMLTSTVAVAVDVLADEGRGRR
jgi:hypothetical protein